MNAETLRENVLGILRGNSVTKDVEALTQFTTFGFEYPDAQEQLARAKAFVASEAAQAAAQATQIPTNGHSTTTTEVAAATAVQPQPIVADAGGEAKPYANITKTELEFVDPLPEVPTYLKNIPNWIRWKLEIDNGRPTKVPYKVTGGKAASTRAEDWTDYRAAITGAVIDATQGVGFVVNGGLVGFDLDGCRDPQTCKLTDWADQIIDALDSYTEITPSGMGTRVWVRGTLPGTDKVFNLDPRVGHGDKVKIEVFTDSRYFTVTGQSYLDPAGDVEERDLTAVYQMLHDIRAKYPAPKKHGDTTSADSNQPVQIEKLGTFEPNKYDIFMNGTIESQTPFVISDGIGRLEYPSQSEADMAFATVLAIKHEGDRQKISEDFRKSKLYRPKWDRLEQTTIDKAIISAGKIKVPIYDTVPAVTVALPVTVAEAALEEKDIPPYNPAIECGFFKEVVDAVCNGTTIPRQFMHHAVKTFVGALVSGYLKFENLDCNSCQYAVSLGASGTGKRTVWNRGIQGIFHPLIGGQEDAQGKSIKVFDGADSGAGLRDAFFDAPQNAPILLLIDEAASLGNKAQETKNPEIVDTIVELADSTSISRVKASKNGKKAARVHNDARLAMYMCAQTGEVVTQAFQGRKKQGIRERLELEFSPPVEPGDMPIVSTETKLALVNSLLKLIAPTNWTEPMMMTAEAKEFVTTYWKNQPQEVREKVRLWKNLLLNTYMRAFSRGEHTATLEDAQLLAEHFERDKAIRNVHFRGEISNKIGLYVERLKVHVQIMRDQLNRGLSVGQVAMSRRDLQTKTNAYRDNEIDFFDRAFSVYGKAHLWQVSVKGANGQTYTKFIPMAEEHEAWNLSAGVQEFKG